MNENELELFISQIPNFHELPASKQIDYFIYFHIVVKHNVGVKQVDIKGYFEVLHIKPYSNIASYLSTNSKGKSAKFLKNNNGYILLRTYRISLGSELGTPNHPCPTKNLITLDIIKNTRGYIEKIATQACVCYDMGLYDGCLVMVRKVLETLIIEAFERYSISDKIKGKDGNFLYLSELIPALLSESKWNISRNATQSIPKIKKLGDLSAHNRRFLAKKDDIDKIKDDLRIVIEELVHLIDYSNWK